MDFDEEEAVILSIFLLYEAIVTIACAYLITDHRQS